MTRRTELEFSSADGVAGYFQTDSGPREPGDYPYMPCRCPGHLWIHEELERGNHPRCWYESDEGCVWFTVVDAPAYGVLTLKDFTEEPCPPGT